MPRLVLSASSVSYSFSGGAGSSLTVGELVQSCSGSNSFSNITLHVTDTLVSSGMLGLSTQATLKSTSVTVGGGGTFALAGGGADVGNMRVGNQGVFAVTQAGSSFTGALTMEEGAVFSFDVNGAGQMSMLTFTGSLMLEGSVELDIEAAAQGTYQLISFTGDGSGFADNDWVHQLQCYDGDLRLENNTLYLDYRALTWNSGTGTWSDSKWNNAGSSTDRTAVTFSAENAPADQPAIVTVNGTVSPGSIRITGGDYQFLEAPGMGGTISGNGNITMSGDACVTSGVSFAGRRVELCDRASMTYAVSGNCEIRMLTTERDTSVVFTRSGEANSVYSILDTNGLAGSLEVSDAALEFKLGSDFSLTGSVKTNADSTLSFRNASATDGITYTLARGAADVAGRVLIGSESDAFSTTLSLSGSTAAAYELAANGVLVLHGDGTFSGSVEGAGSIEVASDAVIHFTGSVAKGNKLALSAGNSLLICGQATAGSADSATEYMGGSDASVTIAQGGSLLSYLNVRQASGAQQGDASAADFARLALDGGTAVFRVGADDAVAGYTGGAPLVDIGELELGSQGGECHSRSRQ